MLGLLLASIGCCLAPGKASAADAGAGSEPPAAQAPAAAGNAVVLGKDEIQGVVGKKVLSSAGEDMGAITNVIVERDGRPRAAVIDFGGFLGVGTRKIAVDWSALKFVPQGKTDQVTLGLTRDQLKKAPEYVEGKPVVAMGASGNTQALPADAPQ
ncbi:MAG: PRC-barrel domain-containing protein [Stellaceae bacterium]